MAADAAGDIAYLTSILRDADRPRYFAALFAPEDIRAELIVIYGFAAEISRIPDHVSNAGLGEIRLQWWRDALLAAEAGEETPQAPALRAILPVLRRHALQSAPLAAMIDARRADLYADPPPTRADLEGQLGETESTLFQMAAIVCGSDGPETADAAGHAGVAYGLARRLATLALDRRRGRSILPGDALAAHGIDAAQVFAATAPATLADVVAELSREARRHLAGVARHLDPMPPSVRLAFLPLAVVRSLLGRIERLGATLADVPAALSDAEMLTRIGWARLRRFRI